MYFIDPPAPARGTRRSRAPIAVAATLALLALSGCAVTPQPLDKAAIDARIERDRDAMYRDQAPITGPLTEAEALARALRYNLDYRLKLMESALARGLLDVSAADMLPKLVADAGYASRSNDSGGLSIGIEDRIISLRPSTSEERQYYYGRATLSWNALDFGLSYYRSKQAADEVNIAEERRRRILQNIALDVRHAYWRALGAQRLMAEADALAQRIAAAIETSNEAERAGVLAATYGLAYQRTLLDAMSLVNAKRQEMQFALRELAALMNLPPGTTFTLADAGEAAPPPAATPEVADLEAIALANRPELREEDYKARIGVLETRRQIASLFPNLNLFAGVRANTNDYLYNNHWSDVGVGLSMDLFRLAALPAIRRANDARLATDETRRLALSMAVLTQVRVAVERYRLAVTDESLAARSSDVDQRLASLTRAGARDRLESELEALRTDARALVSRFQLATARAATQASYGRVLNSIGVDLLPAEVTGRDIPTLTLAIALHVADVERGVFGQPQADARAPAPVRVAIDGLPAGADPAAVRQAVERIIGRNDLAVDGAANAGDALELRLGYALRPPAAGRATARVEWTVAVRRPDGTSALQQTYASFAPAVVPNRALTALAEAATLSVMTELRRISRDANPTPTSSR
ncbi:MAG: TolC family protein [Burkholderiaceae bacterium]